MVVPSSQPPVTGPSSPSCFLSTVHPERNTPSLHCPRPGLGPASPRQVRHLGTQPRKPSPATVPYKGPPRSPRVLRCTDDSTLGSGPVTPSRQHKIQENPTLKQTISLTLKEKKINKSKYHPGKRTRQDRARASPQPFTTGEATEEPG